MSSSSPTVVPILVIHGGAGLMPRSTDSTRILYRRALRHILRSSLPLLSDPNLTAIDIVERVVVSLEECPLFNAGVGAVFNSAGEHEMDATLMDGRTKRCGALTCVKTTRNPIRAARAIMETTPHIFLSGRPADELAESKGLEQVPNAFFDTSTRRTQFEESRLRTEKPMVDFDAEEAAKAATEEKKKKNGDPSSPSSSLGTVGAVCCDEFGNVAVATSTGGMSNKWVGRVGDSAIIGAGSYADNGTAAVSTTGHGESFLRGCIAYDVCARMRYGGATLREAAESAVRESLGKLGQEAKGGLIAVDGKGNFAMPFISEGMYRGYVRKGEHPHVYVWEEEEMESAEMQE